jgi:[acyl-carrier-protein] S-malonyltransferase
MVKIAALFPGQGSQAVGMGRDLAERWSQAAEVFQTIDHGLESALSKLAAWAVLSSAGLAVEAVAGHSLGEYSAIVAARGLDVADAARTVKERGRLMQQAVPVGEGAMAAIIGLDDEQVVAACADEEAASGGTVRAVNFNSPGQVVIAGSAAAVAGAGDRCKERGAKRALPLPVSAPFHSPLMEPARVGLEPTLRELDFQPLAMPLYRNVDARQVSEPEEVRDGFDTFVEVGTGNVLSGLVRRIDREAICYQAGTVETVEKVIAELI